MKERLKEISIIIFLLIIGIPLCILFFPIILVYLIFEFFQKKGFKKRYSNYLVSIEGKKFFCYSNRKNNHHYIEKNIIPNLTNDIEPVFLEGKRIRNEDNREYLSHMLLNVSKRKGFPYIIKISNGKALDISMNNEFYNFKSQNKNPEDLIVLINASFENLKSKV
ncbi:hypothetical protein SAMN05444671_2889 [Flavobacterium sp. CF108]|uniref:hypothetical protein n=1 Tax=unclassified Flavobacterium TaxID=196869 RepID=UPI0008B04C84|nr:MULTISPECIES: hypothetical protein [unclassified Flavobacterium]SEP15750.1 hypothetical protein SAMN04487978_4648 [Flavobacterium sp. fv08]SHH47691.1 hypothetical protein SAMN05444671_2889 [Flavobacterium sp. CF108]